MLLFLVENPPVAIVANAWQTESNKSISPAQSNSTSAMVSKT